MKILDLTLPTPAENLALDEVLLEAAETGQSEAVLRFWESTKHFVVVGYANKVEAEVDRTACARMSVPILRRCSGGGTVVQGPGCLNYTLILPLENAPALAGIPQTNALVMGRQKEALQTLLKETVTVCGHTDLAVGKQKFSGNAQRRKRKFLLFHGTFLLDFDLHLVEKLLLMPSWQPDYRQSRSHREFLKNIKLSSTDVKVALKATWQADEPLPEVPAVQKWVAEKYSQEKWNFKF